MRAKEHGFRQPAEWARHLAVWTAWPHLADEWAEGLTHPRTSLAGMISAIVDRGPTGPRGERVELLCADASVEADARMRLGAAAAGVRFHRAHYGDVWLRDTGPIFVVRGADRAAACFDWNGWGGKYLMPGDPDVSVWLAGAAGVPAWRQGFVLEGGAVEVDGEGTVLTTRQCLLGGTRNPSLDERGASELLCASLGAERVIWLDHGLHNDHTDGHIDTIARYVAPGVVAAMTPTADDPNATVMAAILTSLRAAKDAQGRQLEVAAIPSPGAIVDGAGQLMPASYLNFYIANTTVVVPTYRAANDEAAVAAIAALFPDRRTVGVDAYPVLVGGGGFHCTTQQEPA